MILDGDVRITSTEKKLPTTPGAPVFNLFVDLDSWKAPIFRDYRYVNQTTTLQLH